MGWEWNADGLGVKRLDNFLKRPYFGDTKDGRSRKEIKPQLRSLVVRTCARRIGQVRDSVLQTTLLSPLDDETSQPYPYTFLDFDMGNMQEQGESFVGKGTGGLGELAARKDKGLQDFISFEFPTQMYDLNYFQRPSVGEAMYWLPRGVDGRIGDLLLDLLGAEERL